MALEAATRYLSGAGVGRFRIISAEDWPTDGEAWLSALAGASLILRAGFDDDPMLRAAVRLGLPVVVVRGGPAGADVVSFRHHGPCPHAALDVPHRTADPLGEEGSMAVVAGTLAAAEVVWRLARPEDGPRARHLKLTLDGDPVAQEIPWAPECFLC